jgi:hypothetical protein
MKGKKRKRSVDRRCDQAKKTGKAARTSKHVRGKDQSLPVEEASGRGQAKKGCQGAWNPEKGECDPLGLICSSIASQPLVP